MLSLQAKSSLSREFPNEGGGATLEYLILSLFSLVFSLGVLALISQYAQQKLNDFSEETGVSLESLNFSFLK